MRFRSLSGWAADSKLDGLKFFAQRMHEMLFDFTLDSYRPAALNAPYLATEALNLVSEIEAGAIDYANLQYVLEELVWSVHHDRIAKKLLDADISYYTAIGSQGELSALRLRLEVLSKTIGIKRYLPVVIDDLVENIAKCSKKDIDLLSRSMVTTLINSGVTKQYISSCVMSTFFDNEPKIEDLSVLNDFMLKMATPRHLFDVWLIVSKTISTVADSIKSFKLEIEETLPPEVETLAKQRGWERSEEEVFVRAGQVDAYDPFGARNAALLNLDRLSDLLTLFQHRSRISWQSDVIAIQSCCQHVVHWVSAPRGAMDKASDLRPEKAAKELNTLIRNFSAKGTSFAKFNRVADIHGMAVGHNVTDNQLVNLWTALETLVPSHAGGSKIAAITNAMLPMLMHMYIGKIVRQASFDLHAWDRWRVRKILRKVPAPTGTSWLGRTLRLLCLDENQSLRSGLYEQLRDFHLLRFRIFSISEALSDLKRLRALLNTHEQKITWQIRRIYRTRNIIVHSGRKPPSYIDTLVENAHDYLDALVFEVMRVSCGSYEATSLEQVFEISDVRYAEFQRRVNKGGWTSEDCDFLLGGHRAISEMHSFEVLAEV